MHFINALARESAIIPMILNKYVRLLIIIPSLINLVASITK